MEAAVGMVEDTAVGMVDILELEDIAVVVDSLCSEEVVVGMVDILELEDIAVVVDSLCSEEIPVAGFVDRSC